MKRTGAGVLAVAGVIGIAAGFLVDQLLTAAGRPTFVPGVTLPILLLLLGGFVIVLALPIRRATRGSAGRSSRRSVPGPPHRDAREGLEHRRIRVRGIRRRARALPRDPAR